MKPILRIALRVSALVAVLAMAAFDAARANHYILPCRDVCPTARWIPTGSLNIARSGHTATLLQNGKVLVVGGSGDTSAEVYDPATRAWSVTGSLRRARVDHTATVLRDGRVLVAGGVTDSGPPLFGRTDTAETYDPATGAWSDTGRMSTIRSGHTATLLAGGKVLVAGGYAADNLGSVELYDPVTGIFTVTGSLVTARFWHTATLLENGTVLVAGGSNDGDLATTLASAEVYDSVFGTWTAASGLPVPGGVYHTATRLPDGNVLVAGGNGGGIGGDRVFVQSALFDPATQRWDSAGDLSAARYGHTASLLPNGEVLVAGGVVPEGRYPTLGYLDLDSAEIYDPKAGLWTTAAGLGTSRSNHTATVLLDGSVLVVGGSITGSSYTTTPLDSAELYIVAGVNAAAGSSGVAGVDLRRRDR